VAASLPWVTLRALGSTGTAPLPLPVQAAALDRAGVSVGVRGSSLRVSPHLWTTDEDVDRLVAVLRGALDGH
jgi:selenocysteine lyase/cysteine desulfurase